MNKGFTLVELISVILILGLLAVITTPAYDTISNNIKTRNYESKKSTIKSQTITYVEKYMKNDVYDGTKGTNEVLYLKIDDTGTNTKMNISKALCFTPEYLIRNGIISSDDEKDEYIKNDKDGTIYRGNSEAYIKVYYNLKNLKLNAMIIDEKNIISYKTISNEEKELEIEFDNLECSKTYN